MRTRGRVLMMLLLLPAVLTLAVLGIPARYGKTYLAALPDKAAVLDDAAGPKIVLAGGSGIAFGVDCSLLEGQFPGYTAINFGLYAGLGTAVMLELALPSLQEGDIVIFSPELSGQTLSDWFDGESMWQASEENPGLLARLDISRWEDMLAAFPRYAARKTRLFLQGDAPEGEGVYARDSFTDKGDIRPELRPANRMPGGWDSNMPLYTDESWPAEDFVRRVNDFTQTCRERGVRVYFRFCPMNAAALDADELGKLEAFEQRLRETLSCEWLGSWERAVMEPGWFYDTNFHLNGAGAVVNTALLAEELKEALGLETRAAISLPDQPALEEPEISEGDNRDEALFLYALQGGGLAVTGLTEEGKTRETLTVPASHGGLPVTSLAGNSLQGADWLTEVTLQDSLRSIGDGAFSGCPSLQRIVLTQNDPGACPAGSGLLDGTDALVLVPAGAYASYCTNYFWAAYAGRLRPADSDPAPVSVPSGTQQKAAAVRLTYNSNGGALRSGTGDSLVREVSLSHLRTNTLQGTAWFERGGYTLTGWNTEPDGSGTPAGLGSRIDPAPGEQLYAQWAEWNPDSDFSWETDEKGAAVTGYRGTGSRCVIPEVYNGLPVRMIRQGAFSGAELEELVLPPSLRTVEDGAFEHCALSEILLFDSLETISDACFSGCTGPAVVRVNAATSPVYSGSYFDTFQDKYDYLLSLAGRRKLVLSSGSSGRYGYNCEMLKTAFPELEPVNMGVYAYTNALPQLQLILSLAEEGDLLLYAPEFDAVREQFCVSSRLDLNFWAMMESCYDTAATLDMRGFTGVFDSLGEYLRVRRQMPGKNYGISPAGFDDDGNYYAFSTYNCYGDFTLPRPNGDSDERLRHNIADYTVSSFPAETVRSLNAALAPFEEKGIMVLFSYTPRNSASLTEASTEAARKALEEWLNRELSVPVISRMEDSLMPGRYFWLIDSHLSTEGAEIRTRQIIADLENYLKTTETRPRGEENP